MLQVKDGVAHSRFDEVFFANDREDHRWAHLMMNKMLEVKEYASPRMSNGAVFFSSYRDDQRLAGLITHKIVTYLANKENKRVVLYKEVPKRDIKTENVKPRIRWGK
jgi:hypothetical protein